MNDLIKQRLQESINLKNEILNDDYTLKQIERVALAIITAYKNNKKVLLMGNGGSASDAQHICAELVGRYVMERKGLPAVTLNVNTSNITAIANDYSYDVIFQRELEALGQEGDVAIGFTTSGNSKNVYNALKVAKEKNITTIGFLGKDGGICKDVCDIAIILKSNQTARIQESHITMGHIICELVESEIFNEK